VFSYLRNKGVYFQKHYSRAQGCPDIAVPSKKRAVFIDGDFWHGWKFEQQKKRLPTAYWVLKIEGNIKRDRRNRSALKRKGWSTLRVWEHEIKQKEEATMAKIEDFLLKE
jgi:DNA mismatch endonuclease (patch repair protein)